jgi:hypothetical protein
MAKLSTVLDQIDAGSMLLPEFQRGYVWNRDQVRGLMRSLYYGYPVGGLLVWETEGSGQAVRGGTASAGQKQLLLDGQQRVTTLYGIIRGQAPPFFEGDPEAFSGLRFNVETEQFQFHAPVKMKGDPLWIDVSEAFREGQGAVLADLLDLNWARPKLGDYMNRIGRLTSVLQREFYIEAITGADKTVDVVVDIFNRVNSGGTKLSKGDLALARICAEWGDARPTMRRNLDRWAGKGYRFNPDWLLRNVNAIATGRAPFSALEDVTASDFQDALFKSLHNIDYFLGLVSARLGLDHDRVLMGRYAVPVITRLLHHRGGRFPDDAEAARALYWYVHAALRGRFAGSAETFLAKDLETVDADGIDGVIASLRRSRKGNMVIDGQDFEGVGRGSRSYPLLYLITRVWDGHDLLTGRSLGQAASSLEAHEIFPKAQLAKHEQGYSRSELNAIANLVFLTPSSATALADAGPRQYLGDCNPDALRSQWIPNDPKLWEIENYRDFLAARRELLAATANEFVEQLYSGRLPRGPELEPLTVSEEVDEKDARAAQIAALVEELVGMGYAQPAVDCEITDPQTGRALAVAEAFWADGLQVGQGSPVVLELDPEEADLPRLTELGCEVFTSVDALRGYVHRRNEVASGDRDAEVGVQRAEPEPVAAESDEPADASGSFDRAVLDIIERCRAELRYNPRYFRVMVTQYGALGATRRLLNAPAVSDGFVTLWERQRLDLSVEALVLDERFAHFFSDEEREIARKRLHDFGYGPAAA